MSAKPTGRRGVAILDAKLIELTDRMLDGEAIRAAYRRGHYAGRASQRRGARAIPHRARRPTSNACAYVRTREPA